MSGLYDIFYMLEDIGVYEFLLPFLLVFVVVFAILEKTYIFGSTGVDADKKPKTNINVVVALIIGLLFLNTNLAYLMNSYLSRMSFVIVIGIMFMLITAMFSTGSEFNGFPMWAGVILALGAVIWSLSSGGFGGSLPYWYFMSDSLISMLFILAILGGIVYLVAFAGSRSSS
jgi:hypothetical protein